MRTETLNTKNESELRSMSADEIDAISGGVVEGGCIVLPLPIDPYPLPVEPILSI